MDFKSYLGKGVHHQADQAHNFKAACKPKRYLGISHPETAHHFSWGEDFLDFEKYLSYTRQSRSEL